MARTATVWEPSDRAERVTGEVHDCHGPPSLLHSTVALGSSTVNDTEADVAEVRAGGPAVMVTTGATPSTVQVRVAAGPVLPAASVAVTEKVCGPLPSEPSGQGEAQGWAGPPSSTQEKLDASLAVKPNVDAPIPTVPVGPLVMLAVGATVSTVQVRESGVGSARMPAATARTARTCAPWPSAVAVQGLVQGRNAPPSSRHSKVTGASGEVKVTEALAVLTRPVGPEVMTVSGGSVSTVQVHVAPGAGALTLPAASRARTSKV